MYPVHKTKLYLVSFILRMIAVFRRNTGRWLEIGMSTPCGDFVKLCRHQCFLCSHVLLCKFYL